MVTAKDIRYLWIGFSCWVSTIAVGVVLNMDQRYLLTFVIAAGIVLIPFVVIGIAFWKRHYFVGVPLLFVIILMCFLLPPRSDVRDAANRMLAASKLRQAAVAMHNYHEKHSYFPPPAITAPDGTPLLSWRVSILPFLGEEMLYSEFHLNEPWDSEHNRKLISRMPDIYKCVGQANCPGHHTFIQAFVGSGTILDSQRRVTLGEISVNRGTSNTVLAAEGGNPVVWTKPEDISCTLEQGIGLIGGQFPADSKYVVVHIVFADGSIRSLRPSYPLAALREAVQWKSTKMMEIEWE